MSSIVINLSEPEIKSGLTYSKESKPNQLVQTYGCQPLICVIKITLQKHCPLLN